jgi:hypothetical protein
MTTDFPTPETDNWNEGMACVKAGRPCCDLTQEQARSNPPSMGGCRKSRAVTKCLTGEVGGPGLGFAYTV